MPPVTAVMWWPAAACAARVAGAAVDQRHLRRRPVADVDRVRRGVQRDPGGEPADRDLRMRRARGAGEHGRGGEHGRQAGKQPDTARRLCAHLARTVPLSGAGRARPRLSARRSCRRGRPGARRPDWSTSLPAEAARPLHVDHADEPERGATVAHPDPAAELDARLEAVALERERVLAAGKRAALETGGAVSAAQRRQQPRRLGLAQGSPDEGERCERAGRDRRRRGRGRERRRGSRAESPLL